MSEAIDIVTRPVLRYHGSKWLLANWIIAQMPAHNPYCEPFAGGAAVLLRKPRVAAEVYNDLDSTVVTVFRVLQDPDKAAEVCRRIALTPYSREEFNATYEPAVDEIDLVCKAIARSSMGHGSDSLGRSCRTGFRAKISCGRGLPAAPWANWPSGVRSYVERLRGVVIENRPALDVIERMDAPKTLFYVDPPYVTSTRSSLCDGRSSTHGYRHEMNDDDHRELAAKLRGVRGMVMLSGYRSDLYDHLYGDWERVERETLADGAKPRTECLWFNRAAWKYRPQVQMFGSESDMKRRRA